MTRTRKTRFSVLIISLAGASACTVGDVSGALTLTRADDGRLEGRFDGAGGARLEFEIVDGAAGPTARVFGEDEGALLRVERDGSGGPEVWVGAVPLAEASEDAPRAELLRVSETAEWTAVPELLDAVERLDADRTLVDTLRDAVELAEDAIAAAADSDAPRTQGYSGILYIYGCMSWYQARSVANGRCQSYGYSYANWVAAHAWTRCGTDSYGNPQYGTFEYQCYRGSSW